MTTTPVRTRLRRGVATGAAVAVGALGMVAVAPSARATTGPVSYSCATALGPRTFTVTTDTSSPTPPASNYVGDRVAATMDSALPGDVAKDLKGSGAETFSGTVAYTYTEANVARTIAFTVPTTALGDQTSPTAVPFSGSGTYVPAVPGAHDLRAGDFTATFALTRADSSTFGPVEVSCARPNGQAPTIDSVVVKSKSSTSLTLSKTASQYGEDVTATAKVTTTAGAAGPADGEVAFSADGVVTRVKVDKVGVATLVLPDTTVGTHSVAATFVPRDATYFDGSTTAAQAWEVSKVRTKMRVPVTGKRVGVATKVGVKAKGAFDTVPTGTVRIKLTRVGTMKKWAKVRKFDDQGSATAGFGKLMKGRYKVVVTYRGDTNHDAKKKVKRFRVTRR